MTEQPPGQQRDWHAAQTPGTAPRGAIGRVLTALRPTYLVAAAKTGSQLYRGVLGARRPPGIELGGPHDGQETTNTIHMH